VARVQGAWGFYSFEVGRGNEKGCLHGTYPKIRCNAVFVFNKNNDGSGGHQAHLVKSKQDGAGTLPMLHLVGGDILSVGINL
jgi:hypothetical protein